MKPDVHVFADISELSLRAAEATVRTMNDAAGVDRRLGGIKRKARFLHLARTHSCRPDVLSRDRLEQTHALRHVLSGTADAHTYPAAGVRPTQGTVIWWVDGEAAAQPHDPDKHKGAIEGDRTGEQGNGDPSAAADMAKYRS